MQPQQYNNRNILIICSICLSKDRNMYNLDKALGNLTVALNIFNEEQNKGPVCWECCTILQKTETLKTKAQQARWLLWKNSPRVLTTCLSGLKRTETKIITLTSKDMQECINVKTPAPFSNPLSPLSLPLQPSLPPLQPSPSVSVTLRQDDVSNLAKVARKSFYVLPYKSNPTKNTVPLDGIEPMTLTKRNGKKYVLRGAAEMLVSSPNLAELVKVKKLSTETKIQTGADIPPLRNETSLNAVLCSNEFPTTQIDNTKLSPREEVNSKEAIIFDYKSGDDISARNTPLYVSYDEDNISERELRYDSVPGSDNELTWIGNDKFSDNFDSLVNIQRTAYQCTKKQNVIKETISHNLDSNKTMDMDNEEQEITTKSVNVNIILETTCDNINKPDNTNKLVQKFPNQEHENAIQQGSSVCVNEGNITVDQTKAVSQDESRSNSDLVRCDENIKNGAISNCVTNNTDCEVLRHNENNSAITPLQIELINEKHSQGQEFHMLNDKHIESVNYDSVGKKNPQNTLKNAKTQLIVNRVVAAMPINHKNSRKKHNESQQLDALELKEIILRDHSYNKYTKKWRSQLFQQLSRLREATGRNHCTNEHLNSSVPLVNMAVSIDLGKFFPGQPKCKHDVKSNINDGDDPGNKNFDYYYGQCDNDQEINMKLEPIDSDVETDTASEMEYYPDTNKSTFNYFSEDGIEQYETNIKSEPIDKNLPTDTASTTWVSKNTEDGIEQYETNIKSEPIDKHLLTDTAPTAWVSKNTVDTLLKPVYCNDWVDATYSRVSKYVEKSVHESKETEVSPIKVNNKRRRRTRRKNYLTVRKRRNTLEQKKNLEKQNKNNSNSESLNECRTLRSTNKRSSDAIKKLNSEEKVNDDKLSHHPLEESEINYNQNIKRMKRESNVIKVNELKELSNAQNVVVNKKSNVLKRTGRHKRKTNDSQVSEIRIHKPRDKTLHKLLLHPVVVLKRNENLVRSIQTRSEAKRNRVEAIDPKPNDNHANEKTLDQFSETKINIIPNSTEAIDPVTNDNHTNKKSLDQFNETKNYMVPNSTEAIDPKTKDNHMNKKTFDQFSETKNNMVPNSTEAIDPKTNDNHTNKKTFDQVSGTKNNMVPNSTDAIDPKTNDNHTNKNTFDQFSETKNNMVPNSIVAIDPITNDNHGNKITPSIVTCCFIKNNEQITLNELDLDEVLVNTDNKTKKPLNLETKESNEDSDLFTLEGVDTNEQKALRNKLRTKIHFTGMHQCFLCMEAFPTKRDLSRHQKSHRKSSGDFICGYCTCRFPHEKLLKDHMDLKHRRVLKCRWCDSKHTCPSHVEEHVMQEHPDVYRTFIKSTRGDDLGPYSLSYMQFLAKQNAERIHGLEHFQDIIHKEFAHT